LKAVFFVFGATVTLLISEGKTTSGQNSGLMSGSMSGLGCALRSFDETGCKGGKRQSRVKMA
jgi:hypothetical protein